MANMRRAAKESGQTSSRPTSAALNFGACIAGNYFADVDLVKSGFDGEHTESNHRLMYT